MGTGPRDKFDVMLLDCRFLLPRGAGAKKRWQILWAFTSPSFYT